jgi:hypothetical protein
VEGRGVGAGEGVVGPVPGVKGSSVPVTETKVSARPATEPVGLGLEEISSGAGVGLGEASPGVGLGLGLDGEGSVVGLRAGDGDAALTTVEPSAATGAGLSTSPGFDGNAGRTAVGSTVMAGDGLSKLWNG